MAMSFNSEINDFKKHKLNEKLITETISSTELTIQLNMKYLSSCEIMINMRMIYSIKFMHINWGAGEDFFFPSPREDFYHFLRRIIPNPGKNAYKVELGKNTYSVGKDPYHELGKNVYSVWKNPYYQLRKISLTRGKVGVLCMINFCTNAFLK